MNSPATVVTSRPKLPRQPGDPWIVHPEQPWNGQPYHAWKNPRRAFNASIGGGGINEIIHAGSAKHAQRRYRAGWHSGDGSVGPPRVAVVARLESRQERNIRLRAANRPGQVQCFWPRPAF